MRHVDQNRIPLKLAAILAAALALGLGGWTKAQPVADPFGLYRRGNYVGAAAGSLRAAEAGDPAAQGLLGFLYEYGRGVPQDFVLAAKWYTCAAERGEPMAQYLLGMLYNKGRGVPEDLVLSQKWLILAAARADGAERDTYIRIRDAVASKMSPSEIALAQDLGRRWFPVPRPGVC